MENRKSLSPTGSNDSGPDKTLFSSIKYYLSGVVQEDVINVLTDRGAERLSYFSDHVTHCILGDDYSDNDISDARDLYEVPVVIQDWVLMSVYCKKILPTNAFQAPDKCLLSGIYVCLSKINQADFKALWSLITFYGGVCHLQLSRKITHLITTKSEGAKYEYASRKTGVKIVTPDWLIDSIRSKTICDESLYHPRLLLFPKVSSHLFPTHITGFEVIHSSAESSGVEYKEDLKQLKQKLPRNLSSSNDTREAEFQPPQQNENFVHPSTNEMQSSSQTTVQIACNQPHQHHTSGLQFLIQAEIMLFHFLPSDHYQCKTLQFLLTTLQC